MLGDGIEDYEYVALLDRLLAEHDPAPIETRRQAIGRAIEHLAGI